MSEVENARAESREPEEGNSRRKHPVNDDQEQEALLEPPTEEFGEMDSPSGSAPETTEETNPRSERSTEEEEVFVPAPVVREEHAESSFTRVVEQQTAKIPSHWFLAGSLGAMATSLGLEIAGKSRASRFVGMWAPSLLVMGVYNKLVKSLGPR